jgi:hypothetical protein
MLGHGAYGDFGTPITLSSVSQLPDAQRTALESQFEVVGGATRLKAAFAQQLVSALLARGANAMAADPKTQTIVMVLSDSPAAASAAQQIDGLVKAGYTVMLAKIDMLGLPSDRALSTFTATKDMKVAADYMAPGAEGFYFGGPLPGGALVKPGPKKMGMLGFTAIAAASVGLVWLVLKSGKKSPPSYSPNRRHRRK